MFINRLKIGLLLCARLEKTVHKVETHQLSSKEKVLGAVVNKEDHTDCLLIFPKKVQTVNRVTDCLLLGENFTLFIENALYLHFLCGC